MAGVWFGGMWRGAIAALAIASMPLVSACATPAGTAGVQAYSSERIGVTVRGQGPDVVLIPGLGSSPEVWDSTVAAVPGYRYHIVHVSGFAGRPSGANAQGPVVAPVADEIARYIREAALDRPAIVGHSLGGTWGMMVAARHPELVSRLMVVDMLPFLGAMFGGPAATVDSVRPVAEQIRRGIVATGGAGREAQQTQIIATMVKTENLRPLAVRHGLSSDLNVTSQAFYDLVTTNLIPEIAGIRVPVTVLWVRPPDAPVDQAMMGQFYAMSYGGIPGVRVVNVPDSYHFIMWDNPDFFRRELTAFLAAR